ncbi:MAG: hypothetical protein IJW36_00425 [Clostridia bacterium]|nr:hypothetical protein [Clostridia bacterium]
MTAKEYKFKDKISGKVYFTKQLDILGIDRKYTGYFVLVEILNIMINEIEGKVRSFSKKIYPIVAERFNVADYTIERNIRNLIDKCWSKEMREELNYDLDTKPKCQDFIYIVKEYIENKIA